MGSRLSEASPRSIPSSLSFQHKTFTPLPPIQELPLPCTDEPFLVLPRSVLSSPATSAHLGHQAKLGSISAFCPAL